MTTRQWKAAIAAAGLTVAGLSIGHLPASATADWAVDKFKVCYDYDHCGDEYTEGTITWGQRTATVTAQVVDRNVNWVSVHFHAFAGSTMVDHKTLTAGETFTIGDPDRRGGINRIRTQVCVEGREGQFGCGRQWNDIRD